jgi:Na+/H+ antiporter NhaC
MKDTRYIALLPFGIFLATFIILNITYRSTSMAHNNFPIFAAFIAILVAFFTFQKNESFNEKVEIFIQGSAQTIIIHMCYIFYMSTIFTTVLEQIGGVSSAVNISLLFIPQTFVLPGIFIISSLFSFTVGTSMGAIAAFMPIGMSIADHLSLNPSLMAATIVCGSMFGDNLSILSDTTIAAIKMTNCSMNKKSMLNAKIAAPAFIGAIILLTYHNYFLSNTTTTINNQSIHILDFIKILPYITTFYLALKQLDILVVLIFGTIFSIIIGICLNSLTFLQAINCIFDGFYLSKGTINIFILVLLLAGLSKIISHNGGIDYFIDKLQNKITNPQNAKVAIFILITLINITIAINTIAILITGPIATKVGNKFNIKNYEIACILDIGSCISQGLLPYAPQLLLAASMAKVSTISLLPYLYYQYLLTITLSIMIILKTDSKNTNNL